ncbi:hypothetical protein GCM10017711_03850 [Paeniglutamicibacter sulfureus]
MNEKVSGFGRGPFRFPEAQSCPGSGHGSAKVLRSWPGMFGEALRFLPDGAGALAWADLCETINKP